jgi:hypothetical protein
MEAVKGRFCFYGMNAILTTIPVELGFLWPFEVIKLKTCSLFHEKLFIQKLKARTSYRNGRNTEVLIFENLEPVEITKKLFQHHLNILKNV